MIQIPAILREIASFGGSLYEKGPPPTAVLHYSPPPRVAMSSWHVNKLLVTICNVITLYTLLKSNQQFI